MNKILTIKGTHDILPIDIQKWQNLKKLIHQTCTLFGFKEIRTPIFEKTQLFSSRFILKIAYFFDLILGAFWRAQGAANSAYSMLF